MSRYAVAVLNFFDNDNKCYVVDASNEVEAVCRAVCQHNDDSNISDWVNNIYKSGASVDRLLDDLANGEYSVSRPVLIWEEK